MATLVQPHKGIRGRPKPGVYDQERRGGLPIIKKLKPKVKDYAKILSNPQALTHINNKLIELGELEKAYDIITKKGFYFLEKASEEQYDFLEAFKILPLPPDLLANNGMLDPKSFQERFRSMRKGELEEWRRQFVRYLLENPNAGFFFIFSLERIKPDSNS
jgi:hypothetical protein